GDATSSLSTTAILMRSFMSADQRGHRPRCEHAVRSPPEIATVRSARAKPMLDYLKVFEQSANLFPGFEAEAQGLQMGGRLLNSRSITAAVSFGGDPTSRVGRRQLIASAIPAC